jgi:hypothetical protein
MPPFTTLEECACKVLYAAVRWFRPLKPDVQ